MSSEIITNKPRNPILAFFLAFLFPGFGQVYNGQIKKGLIFLLISFTLPFLLGLTRIGTSFNGFFLILFIDFSFRIYVIYDAVKNAKKLKIYTLKPYNTWRHYLIIIIGISTITYLYDYNSVVGVKSYKIPTTSNEPTVQVSDRLIADLNAYKNAKPNYGDLVVFQKKDSLNPSMYRIIGLPNDKIIIQNNFLIINDKKCKTTFIKEAQSEQFAVNEYEEVLPNGHRHKIYTFKNPFDDTKNKVTEIKIPKKSYFLMGDNRDNAMDSRYIGVINEDEIKGRIVFGYWGNTKDRINLNLRDK